MTTAASPARYGRTAIFFHWTAAVAIPLLIVLGIVAANASDSATTVRVLRIHVVVGVAVLALTLLRALWWSIERRPAPPQDTPRWDSRLAQAVHLHLHILPIVAGISGIGLLVLSGTAPTLLLGSPAPLPRFGDFPPMTVHVIAGFALTAFILLHVLAGLNHHFYRRDRLYARMGIGRP